ncbi:telomere stability/silencing protein [Spatholobus suberectus]|nr:telomere stability/silencing protein [Spatholobus suberectus]
MPKSPRHTADKLSSKFHSEKSNSKKPEGSLGSLTRDGDSSGAASCESECEEEKDTVVQGKVGSVGSPSSEGIQENLSVAAEPVINDEATAVPCLESVVSGLNAEDNGCQDCHGGGQSVARLLCYGTYGKLVIKKK